MRQQKEAGTVDQPTRRNALPLPLWGMNAFSIGFISTALLLFAISAYLCFSYAAFSRTAVHTQAVITELIEIKDKDNDISFKPVLTFTDVKGEQHNVKSYYSFSAGFYEVGQRVDVLYPPDKEAEAELNTTAIILLKLVPGFIGLLPFMLGGVVVYLTYFRRRSYTTPRDVGTPV